MAEATLSQTGQQIFDLMLDVDFGGMPTPNARRCRPTWSRRADD